MKNDFLIAITQLCAEKNLPKEVVLNAIEMALISAYKRNVGASPTQVVTVKLHPGTGEAKVYAEKTVVEDVTDGRIEISLAQARAAKPGVQLGETVEVESTPNDFGRIAAQTAKQVVLQRLREAEREAVFEEFTDKERDIVTGIVQRVEPKLIRVDLGKVEAVLPEEEQVPAERYRPGQRVKALLVEVRRTPKGPEVRLSRTHRDLLRRLFELEVPEIYQGTVEIKSIAREPGSRSKVAVSARQEGIDPVGSCVGMRGIRIQNIVRELNDEKIDVVQWHQDPSVYVANALSPAQVLHVDVDDVDKTANVVVPDRQLSLAIGKEGQNARLAARLTGWRIDIKSSSTAKAEREARRVAEEEVAREATALAAAEAARVAEEAALVAAQAAAEAAALAPDPVAIPEPEPVVVAAPTAVEQPRPVDEPIEIWEAPEEEPVPMAAADVAELEREELPVVVAPEVVAEPEYEREIYHDEEPELEPAPIFESPFPGVPQIRFAEDFFGQGGYRGLEGRKKKKNRKAEEKEREGVIAAAAAAAAAVKAPKKAGRRTRPEVEEDEPTPYEQFMPRGGKR